MLGIRDGAPAGRKADSDAEPAGIPPKKRGPQARPGLARPTGPSGLYIFIHPFLAAVGRQRERRHYLHNSICKLGGMTTDT